ncbi:MAG: PhoU domain-containing protein, partial [Pseudohongiellaceae bacterium]
MDASADKPRSHISQQFNTDLEDLKKHMLEMGGMVEKQFSGAMQALIEADSTLGERIAADDDLLDQMEMKIDEECNLIIARRQPAARDLRLVLAI